MTTQDKSTKKSTPKPRAIKSKKQTGPQKRVRKTNPQADPNYAGRDVMTRFQPGNRFFCIENLGRDYVYKDAAEFADNCASYFKWLEDNPLYEAKAMAFQGESWIQNIPKMRVATIEGICMHIGLGVATWKDWRSGKAPNPVFSAIIERCEHAIREQKFAGAAAGLLNPVIISRDLGLSDRIEQDHKSSDGTMSPVSAASFNTDDLAALAIKLADKL